MADGGFSLPSSPLLNHVLLPSLGGIGCVSELWISFLSSSFGIGFYLFSTSSVLFSSFLSCFLHFHPAFHSSYFHLAVQSVLARLVDLWIDSIVAIVACRLHLYCVHLAISERLIVESGADAIHTFD